MSKQYQLELLTNWWNADLVYPSNGNFTWAVKGLALPLLVRQYLYFLLNEYEIISSTTKDELPKFGFDEKGFYHGVQTK